MRILFKQVFHPSYCIIFCAAILLNSCQKVVNIDLNDAAPKLVIEAVITNDPGPYRVKLAKTGSYFNQDPLERVRGARVIISDNMGVVDTLSEDSAGIYFTHRIEGVPGRLYILQVESEKTFYTAESAMMSAVQIDSVGTEITQRISFGGRNRRDSSINIHFHDPAGEKNFYRIRFIKNFLYNASNYRLYDDEYTNGEDVDLRVGRATKGDTDRIELISLDRQAYDYYRTLNDILRINPVFGSTPANPNTNVSNGALGYFTAQAISRAFTIVK